MGDKILPKGIYSQREEFVQVSTFFPSRLSYIEKGDRNKNAEIISLKVYILTLNLLHSEWPKLHIDIGTFQAESTFLEVQFQEKDGNWTVHYTDTHWETRYNQKQSKKFEQNLSASGTFVGGNEKSRLSIATPILQLF